VNRGLRKRWREGQTHLGSIIDTASGAASGAAVPEARGLPAPSAGSADGQGIDA